jgi:hypothetical protein
MDDEDDDYASVQVSTQRREAGTMSSFRAWTSPARDQGEP